MVATNGKSVKSNNKHVVFYELLLRTQKTACFPAKEFNELIKTPQGNACFFKWLQLNLLNLFKKDHVIKVSINIEPSQLLADSILPFLESLSAFKQQIIIEITERLPKDTNINELMAKLAIINKQGFYILLDDVDILLEYTSIMTKLAKYVHGFKISPMLVATQCSTQIFTLISQLQKFTNYMIIGEGTSDKQHSDKYLNLGIVYQQGWYLGKEELV
nr:EAL domain-containing protein [Periweissella beninensis]